MPKVICSACGQENPPTRRCKTGKKKSAIGWVYCDDCSEWLHATCVRIGASLLAKAENFWFFCEKCAVKGCLMWKQSADIVPINPVSPSKTEAQISELTSLIQKLQIELDTLRSQHKKSIDRLQNKLSEAKQQDEKCASHLQALTQIEEKIETIQSGSKLANICSQTDLPGYNFVRHSLPSKRGRGAKTCGGVGLYIRKGIKVTTILKSAFDPNLPIANRVEYLAVRAKLNDLSICIVVLYNPTASNQQFAQCYERLLLDLQDFTPDRLFIVGDFNINVAAIQQSPNLTALNQIHQAFDLAVLLTSATRTTERSATTIDLMITNAPDTITTCRSSCASTISDHEAIYLISNVRVLKPEPQKVKIRNLRRINPIRLQADFISRDRTDFYHCSNVDAKTEMLTTELRTLIDSHAPEKTITVRDKRTPWITNEIELKGDPQWNDYQQKRSRAATLIFSAKRRYGQRYFSPDLPAQQLWNNLRREGIHNNSKTNINCDLNVGELNKFFAEGHRQLGNNRAQPTQTIQASTHPNSAAEPNNVQFHFRDVDASEVNRRLHEIESNAVGSDGIPISFLKLLSPFLLPVLVELFNKIIATQVFPKSWKKAIVHPIPKNSHPTEPKDFRPIRVLPATSKILENILLAQITEHLNSSEPPMLAVNQRGYRKQHSTTTALAKVTHDVLTGLDGHMCTVMILVDFSLAFNSVIHLVLHTKLRSEFKFSESACNLVKSFHSDRSQMVKIGDNLSSELTLHDGTPQGSCLSSLLFSLYVNSLPAVLRCQYQLYADDLQIYTTGRIEDIHLLIQAINRDLLAIEQLAKRNGLFPNPKKNASHNLQ
ncbi:uncharacterized protein LOC131679696 [Topomyia yanbarensis]|uniref:uncharacterized protein LOC131679696 n=1 Tax=Topomyia yanbarensis TaxID=2498891 RepID=UPI00273BF526|nr:uncharacterized protein LOC131679696 [Topomyia yanbarensis]